MRRGAFSGGGERADVSTDNLPTPSGSRLASLPHRRLVREQLSWVTTWISCQASSLGRHSHALRQPAIDDCAVMGRSSHLSGGFEVMSRLVKIACPTVELAQRGIEQVVVAEGRVFGHLLQAP